MTDHSFVYVEVAPNAPLAYALKEHQCTVRWSHDGGWCLWMAMRPITGGGVELHCLPIDPFDPNATLEFAGRVGVIRANPIDHAPTTWKVAQPVNIPCGWSSVVTLIGVPRVPPWHVGGAERATLPPPDVT